MFYRAPDLCRVFSFSILLFSMVLVLVAVAIVVGLHVAAIVVDHDSFCAFSVPAALAFVFGSPSLDLHFFRAKKRQNKCQLCLCFTCLIYRLGGTDTDRWCRLQSRGPCRYPCAVNLLSGL